MSSLSATSVTSVSALSGWPAATPDPFLFVVYHNDDYPEGNALMQAPRKGNGADFDPSAPYRMYHGDRIPGFPQHPHRGFETITATIEGVIDHSDSHGNAGRYGSGDLQWMTAGSGVVHGEMFPLVNQDSHNVNKFFQIWLNLPAENKMVPPDFAMHWAEDVVKVSQPDGAELTLFAGTYKDSVALPPCPNSWASDAANDVGVFYITLPVGASFTLPPSKTATTTSRTVNRSLYAIEGGSYSIDGTALSGKKLVELDATKPSVLSNEAKAPSDMSIKELKQAIAERRLSASGLSEKHELVSLLASAPGGGGASVVEFLVLQGAAIGEPVAQHGPFVMNTQQEIQQAFADYRRTEFGGWPWPEDAMVFPREKGRFSLMNKEETFPPGCDGTWGKRKGGEL
jgi:redox-sensitive bicupin YhaK (pirin superfamily)